ncbi:hypothetical protein H0H92_006626 [Tricholoma furcatifolium]|nr:hypothetical protein H0H92_006626 [Tricholoma furcatifolium]
MECRMSTLSAPDAKWACQISIRREYDIHGNPLQKGSERRFGRVIHNKEDIELALRRAQCAVLNPHLAEKDIMSASAHDLTGAPFYTEQSLQFSRDIICIDLEGPNLTDLHFIDLPGLVQNAEPDTVKLVEDMVVSHIKGDCLILVALPMTDDIENQKALRLARQVDPDGGRTIGVMTKVDMLTEGQLKAREIWLDIIEGRRHSLVHGYYCTRQPDDAQRLAKITPKDARVAEAKFFSTTSPWSTSNHKNRFGTDNLVSSLSQHLETMLNKALPRIQKDAAQKFASCTQELQGLPTAIDGDPANYMLNLVTSFCNDVNNAVHNGLDANQLVHRNKETFLEYKYAIRKSAPNFIPIVMRDAEDGRLSPNTSHRVDEHTTGPVFTLTDMREHIQRSITRELPNNVPFFAKVDLIAKFQVGWNSSTQVCYNAVRKHVEQMLERQISSTFHRYEHLEGHIRIFVSEVLQKHFDICKSSIEPLLLAEKTPFTQNTHYLEDTSAKWLSKYKAKRSSTLAEHNERPMVKKPRTNEALATPVPSPSPTPAPIQLWGAKAKASSDFGFRMPVNPAPFNENENNTDPERENYLRQAIAFLAAAGMPGITEADLGKLITADEYETEIKVMSEVRGYFQIAYKRVIDIIPSLIDLLFVKAIAKDMQGSLISKLSLGTADARQRCAQYLEENPTVVAKRKELTAQKERLEEVRKALHQFGLS